LTHPSQLLRKRLAAHGPPELAQQFAEARGKGMRVAGPARVGNPLQSIRWSCRGDPSRAFARMTGDWARLDQKLPLWAKYFSLGRAWATTHRRINSSRRTNGRETKCHLRNEPGFSLENRERAAKTAANGNR